MRWIAHVRQLGGGARGLPVVRAAVIAAVFRRAVGALYTVWAGRAIVCGFIALVAAVAIATPSRDWDLLAYVAVASEGEFDSAAALHDRVFSSARQTFGDEAWVKLTTLTEYRENVHECAECFVSQLGFYRLKVGYIWAVSAVGALTDIILAPGIVSFIFGILSIAAFYAVIARLGLEDRFVAFVPVLLAANLQGLARVETPDSMTTFFILLAVYFWTSRAVTLAYVGLAAATLVRPDAFLLVLGLVMAQGLALRLSVRDVAGGAVCLAAYLLTASMGDHVGWWPHFYFTNVAYQGDMRAFDAPFDFNIYLSAVLNGVVQAAYKESWAHMYGLLLLAYVTLRIFDDRRLDRWDILVLAGFLALGGRIVAFPFLTSRIMCPTVLMTAVALGARASSLRTPIAEILAGARSSVRA